MKQSPQNKFFKRIISVSAAVVLVSAICISFYILRTPKPPSMLVVSACREIPPGANRIGASESSIHFDVPEINFTVLSTLQDMPPGMVYSVWLKRNRNSFIAISDSSFVFDSNLNSPYTVFSKRVVEGDIRTSLGRVIGKDRWGYLATGEQ